MIERNKIFRILKILTLLESGHKKWSAQDFADFFGINIRTFHRDRELMEKLGIPIYYDNTKRTYDILDTFRFAPPEITREEALALFLAGQAFEYENFPYQQELDTGLAKIINSLPGSIRKVLKGIENKISFQRNPGVDLSPFKEMIKELERAINTCKTIEITYYSLSRDSTNSRKVDPYTLFFNNAGYLVGYCHLHNEIRIFRIDRVKDLKILNETFDRPCDYSIEDYLQNTWGVERGKVVEVKLLFSGFAAKFVKEFNWHPSQEIEVINDEQILFSVKTGSMKEIKSWILGFGSEVRVLKPEELREEVIAEIEKMRNIYEKTDVQ